MCMGVTIADCCRKLSKKEEDRMNAERKRYIYLDEAEEAAEKALKGK